MMLDNLSIGAAPITRRAALVAGSAFTTLFACEVANARAGAPVRSYAPARRLTHVDHAIVYRREDEMTGWPHVMGYWNFGDGELLQQVTSITTRYGNAEDISHDNLGREGLGTKSVALRSRDWGRTWDGENPTINMMSRIDPTLAGVRMMGDLQPIDFLDRDTIISNSSVGFGTPEGRTDVRVSRDRGQSWSPPIPVPKDALHSIAGMNSVLIRPDGTAMIWLIEVDKEGWNRRSCVFALPPRGTDFHFLTFITPKRDPYGAAD